MSNHDQGASALPTRKKRENGRSATGTYTTAAIICFLLACGVFIVAKPVEKTGPPQPEQQAQGAMLPQGHPDTSSQSQAQSQTALIEQLESHIAMLRQAEAGHASDPALQVEMANALYDLAQAKNDMEAFKEALTRYRKYLEAVPDDLNARTDMAYTLFRTGKLDESIAELYKVQKVNPNHQHSAFNLALMYKEKDQPDSVLAYMKRTVDIDSTTNAGRAAMEVLGAYQGAH